MAVATNNAAPSAATKGFIRASYFRAALPVLFRSLIADGAAARVADDILRARHVAAADDHRRSASDRDTGTARLLSGADDAHRCSGRGQGRVRAGHVAVA